MSVQELLKAVESGELSEIDRLLKARVSPSARVLFGGVEKNALRLAVESKNMSALQVLLTEGAVFEVGVDAEALMAVAAFGDEEMLDFVAPCGCGADVLNGSRHADGPTPLGVAAMHGRLKMVSTLLHRFRFGGLDLDGGAMPPLLAAATAPCNYYAITEALLTAGSRAQVREAVTEAIGVQDQHAVAQVALVCAALHISLNGSGSSSGSGGAGASDDTLAAALTHGADGELVRALVLSGAVATKRHFDLLLAADASKGEEVGKVLVFHDGNRDQFAPQVEEVGIMHKALLATGAIRG